MNPTAPDETLDAGGRARLSGLLRERTHALHVIAERTGVVAAMLRGHLDRERYVRYLRSLLPVYRCMEAGLCEHGGSRAIGAIAQPALYRAHALEADLRALAGVDWERALPVCAAGQRYAQRVADCAQGEGERLVAHAYVRYLGDLNGGRLLRRVLARTLDLRADALRFYDFPGIADLDRFQVDYRRALDQCGERLSDVETVATEAVEAFRLNIALSEACA